MSGKTLISIAVVICFSGLAFGQGPVSVPFMAKADTPPTIDADLGDWNQVYWVTYNKLTEPDGGRTEVNFPTDGTDADLSGVIATTWDENYLYFAAKVQDNVPGAAGDAWFGDGIEIYLSNVGVASDALHGEAHGASFFDDASTGDYEVHLFIRYDSVADTVALIQFVPHGTQNKHANIEMAGALNDDEDGYYLEGKLGWDAIASPTTGNTFAFTGGERVPASWSLIDIDVPQSSEDYAAIQLVVDPTLGPNGNPGGPAWEVIDVRAGTPQAAIDDTIFTYLNEPFMKRPDIPVVVDDDDLGEWYMAHWVDFNKLTEPDGGRTEANFPTDGTDADLSGRIATMWDESYLYFAAEITDNVPGAAGDAWFGDGIEIYLSNVDLASDALHGEDHGATFFDDPSTGDYEVHLFVRYDADADTTALIAFVPHGTQVKDAGIVMNGWLNDDEDGYSLEGMISWASIASPTTGNMLGYTGGERVSAQWSLIDIDVDLSSEDYAAIQLLKHPGFGPNGNPGGRVWNTVDVVNHSFLAQNIIVSVDEPVDAGLVTEFALRNNYPNPFNPTTTITYDIKTAGAVQLAIYNVMGQKIRTLVNSNNSAGRHSVQWDGRDQSGSQVASGIYLYRLTTSGFSQTQKMLLVK